MPEVRRPEQNWIFMSYETATNVRVRWVRRVRGPGGVFSNTIKLMLERQKSSLYQQEMLLGSAKITVYQQDMPH